MNIINQREDELKRVEALNAAARNAKEQVVYATKNIQEGEMISQEALELREVDKGRAPVDAFPNINAIVGQQAAYPIPAGTIVSNHALRPINVSSDFGGRIPEGMRAITFGVDANSGVAGFIAPGNHVDTTIAAATPLTLLPPAPPSVPAAVPNAPAQASGGAVPVALPQHEIEMWQGSRRDVFTVPQG